MLLYLVQSSKQLQNRTVRGIKKDNSTLIMLSLVMCQQRDIAMSYGYGNSKQHIHSLIVKSLVHKKNVNNNDIFRSLYWIDSYKFLALFPFTAI